MSAKKYRNILEYALLLIAVIAFIGLATHFTPLPASQVTALPTPSPSPAPVQPPTPEALLTLTNTERQQAGVALLSLDPRLDATAAQKTDEMSKTNVFQHIGSTGKRGLTYMQDAGIQCITYSENLAEYTPTAESTIAAWMASPAHRATLLNPNLDTVGFASTTRYVTAHFCDTP